MSEGSMADVARGLARGDGQSLGQGNDFGFGSERDERSLHLLEKTWRVKGKSKEAQARGSGSCTRVIEVGRSS